MSGNITKESTVVLANFTCPLLESDVLYIILSASFFFVCLLSIFVSIVLYIVLPKVDLFHANVKFYLRCLTKSVLFAAFGLQLRAVYSCFGWIIGFEKMAMKDISCLFLLVPYTYATNCLTLFVVCIGVDRYVAIKNAMHVDPEEPTRNAKLSSYIVWTISAIFEVVYFFDLFLFNDNSTCFCNSSSSERIEVQVFILAIYFLLQVGVIFLFWFVYRQNRVIYQKFNISSSSHNLHERFHLSSNMKATAMLIPYLIVHMVMGCVSNIFRIVVGHTWEDGYLDYSGRNVILLMSNFCVVDLLIAPIFWIRHHESLNKIASANFPRLNLFFGKKNCADDNKTTNDAGPRSSKVNNFRVKPEKADEILQNIWATKVVPSRK